MRVFGEHVEAATSPTGSLPPTQELVQKTCETVIVQTVVPAMIRVVDEAFSAKLDEITKQACATRKQWERAMLQKVETAIRDIHRASLGRPVVNINTSARHGAQEALAALRRRPQRSGGAGGAWEAPAALAALGKRSRRSGGARGAQEARVQRGPFALCTRSFAQRWPQSEHLPRPVRPGRQCVPARHPGCDGRRCRPRHPASEPGPRQSRASQVVTTAPRR